MDNIARELNVSLGAVSLTITSYMIAQGISPLIWGSFSDTLGRRPIYIASFVVYIIANIALSATPNFTVLLVVGVSSVAAGWECLHWNGVIQDISPPAERGGFIAFYQAIRNFSIAIGPVLGGILSEFLGFRSIFAFLLTLSSLVLVVMILFLPETLRSIAGNGSLRLTGIYLPFIQRLAKGGKGPEYLRHCSTEKSDGGGGDILPRKQVTVMTFVEPLKLLGEKDILFNLIFGGVVYAIWSMVTSSTRRLFKQSFRPSEILIGLSFLANGLGTIIGSAIVGKLMTRDFTALEARYKHNHDPPLPPDFKLAKNIPLNFPLERARLRHLPWISVVFILATGTYGFSLAVASTPSAKPPEWIAIPLLLQFVIAATSNAVFALNQTIAADLCPGRGASATAVNNLVRCGLGAAGVAVVDGLINGVGVAAAFLGLAMMTVAVAPFAVVNWYWGMEWRRKRAERKERGEAEERERERARDVGEMIAARGVNTP